MLVYIAYTEFDKSEIASPAEATPDLELRLPLLAVCHATAASAESASPGLGLAFELRFFKLGRKTLRYIRLESLILGSLNNTSIS